MAMKAICGAAFMMLKPGIITVSDGRLGPKSPAGQLDCPKTGPGLAARSC